MNSLSSDVKVLFLFKEKKKKRLSFTWAELLDQDEAMGGGIEDQHRDTEQRQRGRRGKEK